MGWICVEDYLDREVEWLFAKFNGFLSLNEVNERRKWERDRYFAKFMFASSTNTEGAKALLSELSHPFPWEGKRETNKPKTPEEQEEFVRNLKRMFGETD